MSQTTEKESQTKNKHSNDALILRSEGDYGIVSIENPTLKLFADIKAQYNVEPIFGEVMLVKGQLYWTSKGCARLAAQNHVRTIDFEYLEPSESKIPAVRKRAESIIAVKCTIQTADGSLKPGFRFLDIEEERRVAFPNCFECGNGSKFHSRTENPLIKICSKCKTEIKGYDLWKLKDYINFAETKAFMRAVKFAFPIQLFEDLPDEERRYARDITIEVQPGKTTKIEHSELNQKMDPVADPIENDLENPFEGDDAQILDQIDEKLKTITEVVDFEKIINSYEQISQHVKVKVKIIEQRQKAINVIILDFHKNVWIPVYAIKQVEGDSEHLLILKKILLEKKAELIS